MGAITKGHRAAHADSSHLSVGRNRGRFNVGNVSDSAKTFPDDLTGDVTGNGLLASNESGGGVTASLEAARAGAVNAAPTQYGLLRSPRTIRESVRAPTLDANRRATPTCPTLPTTTTSCALV